MTSTDIFNRPPAISEDTLQYTLYPPSDSSDQSSVTSLAALIASYVQTTLPNFIWHRDSFELKVVQPEGEKDEHWMLEGRMRVGDCVDDEWCAVWLLKEISARWDVSISVVDSDGEFLLIEAADALPSWITPSNSENRVWIYNSNLHIIPLSYKSSSSSRTHRRRLPGAHESDEEEGFTRASDDFISTREALKVLRDGSIDTRTTQAVDEAVWRRISGYPTLLHDHLHITKAFLPIDVAKALSQDPALVQRATEAFYTRDALQLRAAQRMSRFSPQPEILTSVTLTRTAYAQLVGQKFHPPKVFGLYRLADDKRERRWTDVGVKIACGFEMLYQEDKSRTIMPSADANPDSLKDRLRRNPDYTKYIQNLQKAGYFKEELEGSKIWNEQENKAAQLFVNSRSEDDASRSSFASLVNAAIFRAGDGPAQPLADEEQPDDWLNVDADNLEATLAENLRPSHTVGSSTSDGHAMDVDTFDGNRDEEMAQAQADQMKGLADKIEKFVEGQGTLEGAVFDDEMISDDEDAELSEFSDEEFPSDNDSEGSEDEDARRDAMDKLVAGIGPSEYGKMPASFYTNSQKTAPSTVDTEPAEQTGPVQEPVQISEATSPPSDQQQSLIRPIRRPILVRDKYDGVDSDDETDEDDDPIVGNEGGLGDEDDESEEDRPQVVGEIEIDMAEEEDDFIEFAKEALGIKEDQWATIMQDRKDRGAFIPASAAQKANGFSKTKAMDSDSHMDDEDEPRLRKPKPGPRPNVNPNLDSFEAVMQAMDVELARARSTKESPKKKQVSKDESKTKMELDSQTPATSSSKVKGKGKALPEELDDEDKDEESAMDAELRAMLQREEGDSGDEEEPMDYNLIKNFLESFKSQSGLSGPVSTLAGRLEPAWHLPRDES